MFGKILFKLSATTKNYRIQFEVYQKIYSWHTIIVKLFQNRDLRV